MNSELDSKKSAANKSKHGIDFEEAQALWQDEKLLMIPAQAAGEPRFLCVGKIEEKHWSAIITERNGNIRIISIRRARKDERDAYKDFRI